ncbi:transaldolase [Bacterioplanes sanyensis]|uniref:Transaldolase n=1 Tax=Bacterioplanes sanyensis TaxID=1249553 RepID=A0A222FN11_9GAMM|nr:transaldolase [Bacterioplanes sanyensis]ASP39761.1 transaldolase [Bacterioplanes sanyensis]
MSKLESLRTMTSVVADTGDIEAIRQHRPEDATTNPSLVLKAAALEAYQPLIDKAINEAKRSSGDVAANASDLLAVYIGREILQLIPGRISTEVDARLSFDTQATIAKAEKLIELYQQQGISKERILIKIAATWEGIEAARALEQRGIQCNLTLLFSFAQAAACADAGVTLISPFVGRILDWHKAQLPGTDFSGANDPGVQSVTRIYRYYKQHGYNTIVMGASFRNTGEIEQLAGCDKLTIAPDLLAQLQADPGTLERLLDPSLRSEDARMAVSEASFRWQHNEDAMSTDKLSDGIRRFAADQILLEQQLRERIEC